MDTVESVWNNNISICKWQMLISFNRTGTQFYHHFLKGVKSSAVLGKARISISHIPACDTESVDIHIQQDLLQPWIQSKHSGKGEYRVCLIPPPPPPPPPVITYLDTVSFLYALSLYLWSESFSAIICYHSRNKQTFSTHQKTSVKSTYHFTNYSFSLSK